MNPEISIIMATYNSEKYVKDSIISILDQSYGDFEFIIVDDESTDDTKKIINKFTDSRIKFVNKKHLGLAAALNYGIKLSNGKFIARMDADDISNKNRIENQINYLKNNNNIDLVGTSANIINESNDIIGEKNMPTSSKFIADNLIYNCCIIHPSYFFRKEIFDKLNGYREHFIYAQDYDFLLRAHNNNYKFMNLEEKLIKYRVYKTKNIKKKYNQMRYSRIAQTLFKERKLNNYESSETKIQLKKYIQKINSFIYFKHFLFDIFNSKRISNTKLKFFWIFLSYIICLFDKELKNIIYNDSIYYFNLKKNVKK